MQASFVESFLPEAMLMRSKTVMPLKRTGCWKAKLMPRRARSVMDMWVMSSPSSRIWPEVGCSIPAMSLAMVDLPLPFGPVMTTMRSSTVRLTSLRI